MQNEQSVKQNSTLVQLIRFGVAGVLNTFVDFGALTMTSLMLATILGTTSDALPFGFVAVCNVFAYICGIVNSWLINSTWTFQSQNKTFAQSMKFVGVCVFGLLVNTALIYILPRTFSISTAAAKIIAIPVNLIINFLGSKFIVFRNK